LFRFKRIIHSGECDHLFAPERSDAGISTVTGLYPLSLVLFKLLFFFLMEPPFRAILWALWMSLSSMAALEPAARGVLNQYGSVERGAARGLALRMDHGTQYLSGHFLNQIKAWGIAPSFAFLREPETNGVAERFIRTLKEQAIYGRIFHNLEEVRQAVLKFMDQYNQHWRIEKNGLRSPLEMRRLHNLPEAA
jgi:hypothetical protein